MSATDLAAVTISMAALVAVGLVVVMVVQLRRATADLAVAVAEVRQALDHTVGRVEGRVDDIDAELSRAQGLLDTAATVTARADRLSRVTYGAVAKPVIKTAAVVKGTSRAARVLRRGIEKDERAG